jgi:hypothetical protein
VGNPSKGDEVSVNRNEGLDDQHAVMMNMWFWKNNWCCQPQAAASSSKQQQVRASRKQPTASTCK